MARLIDADKLLTNVIAINNSKGQVTWSAVSTTDILTTPTVDAVPVSELKKLRDYLYEEDLIFMRGLAELNKLIANYGAKMDGEVSE